MHPSTSVPARAGKELAAVAKADVIIHPTRLRIIQTFGGGRRLTAQQLAELLPDIPRASLYRHLHLLVEADILAVVEERPVRAIQERVYALVAHAANVGPAEYTASTAEEHLHYFTTFLELLRGDFIRYLQRDTPIDAQADGVAYYQMPLHLSAEEYQQLIATLQGVLWPLVAQPPTPWRQRRLLSIIAMPAVEAVPDPPLAERADEDVTADVPGWDATPTREKG